MKVKWILALLAVMLPAMGLASIGGPPPCVGTGCDYSYTLQFTGLQIVGSPVDVVEDTSNTWTMSFDWAGPYRNSSPPNSLLSYGMTGAPVSGWSLASIGFSSNGTTDTFIDIYFQDSIANDTFNGSTAHYHVTGTDAFWASIGGQIFDPANAFSDGTIVTGGNSYPFDPPCTECAVDLSTSLLPPSPSDVPEPSAWLLLGTLVAGIGVQLRKRLQA